MKQKNKIKWIGDVILIRPMSFTLLTTITASITVIIIAFFYWGTYTKRTTAKGQLVPNTGLIRVYSNDLGVLEEKFVNEGQKIKINDNLLKIKMKKFSNIGDNNLLIEQQILSKREELNIEKIKIQELNKNEYIKTKEEIELLKSDINKMNELIKQQNQRVSLAKDNVNRYAYLQKKEYISTEELQAKQDILLNQKIALQSYERDRIEKQAVLINTVSLLNSLSSKLSSELSNINRQIASNQLELIENKANNLQIIKANTNGTISSINVEVGQQINPNINLLNIIPDNSTLEAHLYISTEAIGFLKKNQKVNLRLHAYPFQKFGHAQGRVISISETTIRPQELLNTVDSSTSQQRDSIYLVKVELKQKGMQAYGEVYPFKAGMTFDADIMQEERKLYEWVLEPLYSIKGKL
ncbi:HlyD family efflux transporter periplasmic adaptor subunit [Acinetobacter sp. NEB 394]|uniref:HlyD family secretion protein n=1 Tax=Acinetobacter sp. NEB 394 TaxID=2743575 RepID=UPI001596DA1E|nr:HlyD family efflux transporter periplasmic adaptor subunit [Acinetobacter sp. NEB 394]QKY89418.1 HlyD family efflux transporter periplasmic adaptor subunit [Acinetobacter sp. NEB 394]